MTRKARGEYRAPGGLEELAWAAGLFDGEGHTTTSRMRRITRVELGVTQSATGVLYRFQSAVGCGSIYGPFKRKHGAPSYVYRITSYTMVCYVLRLLWKNLSTEKRSQALTVIKQFRRTRRRFLVAPRAQTSLPPPLRWSSTNGLTRGSEFLGRLTSDCLLVSSTRSSSAASGLRDSPAHRARSTSRARNRGGSTGRCYEPRSTTRSSQPITP